MSKWLKRGLVSIGLILLLASVYYVWLGSQLFSDDPFLTALLRGDDSLNDQYLSSEFQQYISQNCPDGEASACIRLISSNWGELTSVKFGVGSPNGILFYSWWSNSKPIVIVLLIGEENGHQVYTGWRGFIPSEGENRDAELLQGQRQDNAFPPPT
jgi:hypothetical protein